MVFTRSFIVRQVFEVQLTIEHDVGILLGETYVVIVIVIINVV